MNSSKEYWVDEGTGEIIYVPDAYRDVTTEDADRASQVENLIIDCKSQVTQGFQRLAAYLDIFEREKFYLARGFPSLRAWASSDSIDLSPRLVHDLIRIQRELLPVLGPGANDAIAAIGIAKTRELLPLLNEGMEEQALELVTNGDAAALTWTDLRQEIKRIRGVDVPFDQRRGPLFYARVRQGEVKTRISIRGSDGVGVEEFGVLQIPNAWATKFIERFNNLVEFESEQ